ncbi:hypothetical protein SPHINGOT1_20352 [Sphingomonas sp. T1]|nr:hypothetical protein SPHINGOT1_20352 [Sphingomonas sp. T1]
MTTPRSRGHERTPPPPRRHLMAGRHTALSLCVSRQYRQHVQDATENVFCFSVVRRKNSASIARNCGLARLTVRPGDHP